MIETLSKNLWLLLTVVLPGFFTYGLWRLCLFFVTEKPLSDEALKQIDESTMTTTCIIFAFALMQQAIAIAIEWVFFMLGNSKRKKSPFRILFCDRFNLAYQGRLNERAERMIGNFFSSLNVCIGICLLIGYFYGHIGYSKSADVIWALLILLPPAAITTYFRMTIAEKVISECKNMPEKSDSNQSVS